MFKNSKLFIRTEGHYTFIDGIRALAVLWVIFFHSWLFQIFSMPDYVAKLYDYPVLNFISRGDLGVDLFFVISGFLIGNIIFKEIKERPNFNFKKFFVRRFLRLMPVYIFAMILNLYFMSDYGQSNILDYWSNILYVNNYVSKSPMGWTWSLAIEEQFYIVVPFLLVFIFPLFRNKAYFFIILSLITISLNWYYVFIYRDLSLPLNTTFGSKEGRANFEGFYILTHLRYIGLLSGVAIAYLNVYKSLELKQLFLSKQKLILIITGISVFVFLLISSMPNTGLMYMKSSIFYHLNINVGKWYLTLERSVFSVTAAMIILICIFGNNVIINPIKQFLSLKFFYPIAQLSYSAYLFHEMFILWVRPKLFLYLSPNYSQTGIFFITVVISLIGTIIGAVIMFYLIEQPFQKIRNKIKFN
jgi:peptidoglycan/LPS O-acetylase OafA/YrhL